MRHLLSFAAIASLAAVLFAPAPGQAAGPFKTKAEAEAAAGLAQPSPARPATVCPVEWPFRFCYSGTVNVPIPDNNPIGTLIGAAPLLEEGLTIDDVIVTVNMAHTYVGDLVLQLYYDANNDGFGDVGPIALMCTPGIPGCAIEDCCGCEGDINGEYTFSDGGSGVLGEAACVQQLPPDCYQPDPAYGNLQMFDGASDGGQFLLYAWDYEAQDTGTIFDFRVAARLGCGHPVINVPADYPTVQAAVEAACDGDIIRIAPGTYGDVYLDPADKTFRLEAANPNLRPTLGHIQLLELGSGCAVRNIIATDVELRGSAPFELTNVSTTGGVTVVGTGGWITVTNCTIGGELNCQGFEALVQGCTLGSSYLLIQADVQLQGCITGPVNIDLRDFGGGSIRENTILGRNDGSPLLRVTHYDEPVSIERNLLVGGPSGVDNGVLVSPTGSAGLTKLCNDVWRCATRWSGTSDPTGTGGNISVNPIFCNAGAGNYSLNSSSPCAPGHHPNGANCGVIGARPVGCPTSGIDDAPLAEVPLVTAAPNPSRGQVTFSIAAGEDPARVQIFDASGRSVRTIDVAPSNGARVAVWDQRDDAGNAVASGMYFFRASASGREAAKRLIVLR